MGENKGSKLLVTSVLDVKDDLEEVMPSRCNNLSSKFDVKRAVTISINSVYFCHRENRPHR